MPFIPRYSATLLIKSRTLCIISSYIIFMLYHYMRLIHSFMCSKCFINSHFFIFYFFYKLSTTIFTLLHISPYMLQDTL